MTSRPIQPLSPCSMSNMKSQLLLLRDCSANLVQSVDRAEEALLLSPRRWPKRSIRGMARGTIQCCLFIGRGVFLSRVFGDAIRSPAVFMGGWFGSYTLQSWIGRSKGPLRSQNALQSCWAQASYPTILLLYLLIKRRESTLQWRASGKTFSNCATPSLTACRYPIQNGSLHQRSQKRQVTATRL